jgi:protein TonB
MKPSANALFYPALGISAMAHLLLLLFLPYTIAQPSRSPVRELIPIRLFQAPAAARAPAIQPSVSRQAAAHVQAEREPPAIQQAAPMVQSQTPALQEPPPAATVTPVSSGPEAPPIAASDAGLDAASNAWPQAALAVAAPIAAPIAAPTAAQEAAAVNHAEAAEPSAEIAAYQAILSTLRGRIVESIRYPVIARANGWKGTVVLSVRLDAAGHLQETIVRRSSGYEVLDRAAAALLRKVTPVSNPLSRPVSIEIPIVYELK